MRALITWPRRLAMFEIVFAAFLASTAAVAEPAS